MRERNECWGENLEYIACDLRERERERERENIIGCWLVVWVLWHINLCRIFNAKSVFMKIVLFQTISTQFKCTYSLIVKNISISSYSV